MKFPKQNIFARNIPQSAVPTLPSFDATWSFLAQKSCRVPYTCGSDSEMNNSDTITTMPHGHMPASIPTCNNIVKVIG